MQTNTVRVLAPSRALDHERFLPIVRRIAMRMARRVPPEVTVQDLIGYGWVGLLEALGRSPAGLSEEELEAWVSYRTRGAMLDHLRSLDPMGRVTRGHARRIAKTVAEKTRELGRIPDEPEIAAALGMSVDDYRASVLRIAGTIRSDIADLDELHGQSEMPDEQADEVIRKKEVMAAIVKLPERLQHVLALYYQEGCTLLEIGRILGVTEARACQLHRDAMRRIRALVPV